MSRYVTIDDALGVEQQQLLTEMDILEDLPQAEVESVATRCPIVRLGKKVSITLGEDPHGIRLLVSGRLRVHEPALRGQDLTFSVAEGGTLVGQIGFISQSSQSLRVEALDASILRIIRWVDFRDLVLHNRGGGEDYQSANHGSPGPSCGRHHSADARSMLAPLLTPPSAQHSETLGNRQQRNRLR
jgi:hypothetical protein